MKKLFTIVALALMVMEANALDEVYKIDYSTKTGFPFYVMGYVPEWVDGQMTDYGAMYSYDKNEEGNIGSTNTQDNTIYYKHGLSEAGWHQYFIADNIPTVIGNTYKVKALVKATATVNININMGWGWGEGQSKSTSVTIPQSDDFVEVKWEYSGIGGTNSNLVAQPGTSTATIVWKEVLVYNPGIAATPSPVYGDLYRVTPKLFAKNAGEGWGTEATSVEDVYTVESGTDDSAEDWATQFWIATPEAGLPVGQKFYVEFDYKADHAANVQTQTQLQENGGYKTWHCVGETDGQNISFTTDWKTLKKEVTIESDMEGWKSIAFNLNCDKTANKYYFRNIVLKVPEQVGEKVDFTVGSAGWNTFSSNRGVSLGTAKGYVGKYNGSTVELTPVTEVPAYQAVLIEGTGDYSFTVIPSATAITDNDLLISDGDVLGDGSIFALAKKNDVVGFYKVATGVAVPAGKAYLKIPAASRDFVGFDFGGETTGIEKASVAIDANAPVYNLNGQRVAQPTRGLYIVNGKKVIIK